MSWIPSLTFLIFIAWVPIFYLENEVLKNEKIVHKTKTLYWYAFLTFFVWNLFSTWWVAFASFGGAAMAIGCNALLMSCTYLIYLLTSKKFTHPARLFLFIPFWIAFEYLHTDWDLSWTWLTLGNVFAFKTSWIQWYEYTGVSGGTLWVLLINSLVSFFLIHDNWKRKRLQYLLRALATIFFVAPFIFSQIILKNYKSTSVELKNKSNSVVALIVQPSFDPYIEKFDVPFHLQFKELQKLISKSLNNSVDYLVLPETYIPHQFLGDEIYENQINDHPYIRLFFDSILKKYPRLHIISGADTHYQYADGEERQATARKYADSPGYFESFNSSVQLAQGKKIYVYHKSKLVPGVEMMPFPKVLGLLSDLAIQMGGTSGSLGKQKNRSVFNGPKGARVGTPICYESVFGEHVAEYVLKGANVLFILTNDAWWFDTPGYKQHLAYACLRAIETRKYIARSANTGISCMIDDLGEVRYASKWFEKTVIKCQLPLSNYKTFFVLNGDLVSKVMLWLAFFVAIIGLVLAFRR